MASQPQNYPQVEEGLVACSPNQWAQMVMESQSIPVKDPQKNSKLWDFGIKEHVFSSGSDLSKEDYLRLRVLWYTWTDQGSFAHYARDNLALVNDEQDKTPYTGYISPENDEIANEIFKAIQPQLRGYLEDIERVGRGDADRPSVDCGMFYMPRYWQGLVTTSVKEIYNENEKKRHFRRKIRKSEAGLLRPAGPSRPPQTPAKQKQPRQPHEGFGTPPLDAAGPSAGGFQNPATTDETYVNTAVLLLLQTITSLMAHLQESYRTPPASNSGSRPSSRPPSRAADVQLPIRTAGGQPPSRNASQERAGPSGSQANSRSGSVERDTEQVDQRPSNQQSVRASSTTRAENRDNSKEVLSEILVNALPQLRELAYLDWLPDRLALELVDRSGTSPFPRKLMEARVDGYLCRRERNEQGSRSRPNGIPLAIVETKPFTRSSAISSIRWQESAEVAAWVSGLDDRYENVGLLRSSTSKRKRLVPRFRLSIHILSANCSTKKVLLIPSLKKAPLDLSRST